MLAVLLLGTLMDLQTGAGAGPPPRSGAVAARVAEPVELKVVVAAPVYQPDGGTSVETAAFSSAAPSLVYVYGRRSLCDTATTGGAEPADAGFGWRLAANTMSRSASEIVVSIDWQRLWDGGRRIAGGPSGTVQLTLHPGDRIPLDHIPNMLPTDACRAVGMGLEVRLARAALAPPPDPGGVVLPLGAVQGGAKVLDAELWLLHTLPSGTQQVQHQTVRLPVSGATFSFTPVKLSTTDGEVGVELTGSIQRYRAPSAGEFLLVSMARVITGGPAPPGGFGGTTPGTLIALPGPTDVLSFELPSGGAARRAGGVGVMGAGGGGAGGMGAGAGAASGGAAMVPRTIAGGGAGGGGGRASMSPVASIAQALRLLDGHAFSIRVRVTPVPGS